MKIEAPEDGMGRRPGKRRQGPEVMKRRFIPDMDTRVRLKGNLHKELPVFGDEDDNTEAENPGETDLD